MSDPASLQNLNDIVVPAAIAWWPPAPGWYGLAAALLILLGWAVFKAWSRWKRNAYRREALQTLAGIRENGEAAGLCELPALLKRAALSAWPREAVASLNGLEWHRFLDETSGTRRFAGGLGPMLDVLAYGGGQAAGWTTTEREELLGGVEFWLREHRSPFAAAKSPARPVPTGDG